MDPFERAREAVKSLPGSTTPKPAEEQKSAPVDATGQQPETKTSGHAAEKPGEAFTYGGAVIGDVFNVVSGGAAADADGVSPPSTAYVGLLDLSGEVDTGAAGLWDNGTFLIRINGYGGQTPSDLVGDFHGLSSIDSGSSEPFFRLMEAWYQHSFEYGKSSFLVGIHDWNSEFYVSEYSNLYMNGTPGMGSVVSASAGPSNYPATTLGLRYYSALTEDSYFQLAVYDGTPDAGGFFQVKWTQDDGIFVGTEVGLSNKEPGEDGYFKAAIGGWYLAKTLDGYTGVSFNDDGSPENFDDGQGTLTPVNYQFEESASGTYGAYFVGEMAIGDNIGVFFKAGWADPSVNRYSQFYAGGLNYSGLVPDRVDDVLGVGVYHTRQGQWFLDDNSNDAGYLSFIAETTYEVTYSAQINDWLMIQPDLQFIVYPNMSYAIPNTTVVGIRLQAEF